MEQLTPQHATKIRVQTVNFVEGTVIRYGWTVPGREGGRRGRTEVEGALVEFDDGDQAWFRVRDLFVAE